MDSYVAGAISGNWHSTYIDTTVNGVIVQSVLAAVDERDPGFREASDRVKFIAFREPGG